MRITRALPHHAAGGEVVECLGREVDPVGLTGVDREFAATAPSRAGSGARSQSGDSAARMGRAIGLMSMVVEEPVVRKLAPRGPVICAPQPIAESARLHGAPAAGRSAFSAHSGMHSSSHLSEHAVRAVALTYGASGVRCRARPRTRQRGDRGGRDEAQPRPGSGPKAEADRRFAKQIVRATLTAIVAVNAARVVWIACRDRAEHAQGWRGTFVVMDHQRTNMRR